MIPDKYNQSCVFGIERKLSLAEPRAHGSLMSQFMLLSPTACLQSTQLRLQNIALNNI